MPLACKLIHTGKLLDQKWFAEVTRALKIQPIVEAIVVYILDNTLFLKPQKP